ncbi:hypothetical protein [Roseinatronobacter alkalisoli]|uniref:FDX-ACB domain-containing protein n=1 Tax=Roseinatronobacter alkalisoli TaxID=3028235 RepID=A0ABT5TF57_9RHOB|nr:hypothetical protein [Roseinatronobacter sp. HJB301]MDD7973748.1 hypothetical protein [Roseinatronobacter sp. HJB301]
MAFSVPGWNHPRFQSSERKRVTENGVLTLSEARLSQYAKLRDLTDPAQGKHAINLVLDRLVTAVSVWSGLPAEIFRRDPVVPIEDNFDRLYYDANAIARSTRYTHHVSQDRILRTHTTAAIPSILTETLNDRLIVCPGLVYRRDVVDKTHVGEPHQADLWIVRQGRLGRLDLQNMIKAVVHAILPDHKIRCNETWHSYTVNGLEIEVQIGDRWIELFECGECHPWLLHDAGFDCGSWSGLAMGVGLDRLVMLLKGIDDIRLLRSTDPRVSNQMQNLDPYRIVSNQPPMRRDLSLCISDTDMEVFGDRVRDILGDDADWIEDIELLSVSNYESTPEKAKERLGMAPGQSNILIRITLRSVSRSLSRDEGNRVYDLLYRALHEGSAGYVRTDTR